jgi:hypothetical protein
MVWYNPMTWFSPKSDESIDVPMPMASSDPSPPAVGGPYGGKKRKTRRAKKSSKRHGKTGKARRA